MPWWVRYTEKEKEKEREREIEKERDEEKGKEGKKEKTKMDQKIFKCSKLARKKPNKFKQQQHQQHQHQPVICILKKDLQLINEKGGKKEKNEYK